MKINSRKREQNKVVIEVEEEYSAFEKAIENAITEAGKEIKLPGFRPGKAPRDMVERSLNREVIEHHAAQDLVSGLYPKVIEETKIDPVDYPNVEIIQQEKDKPFIFKVSVDVYPEVKLGKYKGIKIEKKSTALKEEDVLKVLGRLHERFAVTNAEGKKELLPLDDEFAKKVSRHGTMAELKEEMREAMQKELETEAESDVRNKLISAASTETKVDIPPAMVDREVNIMLDELRTSLAQGNLTLEDYLKGSQKEEKTLREEMRKSAGIRVKGKMVLRAVAEEEKTKVSEEEMRAEIKALAGSSGQEAAEFEKGLGEGGKKYIEDYLLRKKALDFMVEKAEYIKEEAKQ